MLDAGYGKIFKQIYASTLRTDWKALITFEQFIVLCDPYGVLDMPPEAISAFTGIPIDIIPVSRGGGNEISNLVTACGFCNRSKGSKLLKEWQQ